MCNFFSFKTDGNKKIFYFSGKQRKDRVTYKDGQKIDNYDSHTSIEAYYGLRDTDWSSGEYDPFTDKLVIDTQNTTWNDEKVREMLAQVDWNDLCGDLHGARDFIASLKTVPWFRPDGSLQESKNVKIFETRAAAHDAARDAAHDAAWAAARNAAWDAAHDAARDAAHDAAWAAARNAAWAAAHDAAWDAARAAARAAAHDAAWDAARNAAWDAARNAGVYCCIEFVCKGLELSVAHKNYFALRWSVWKHGYGVLCDVNGVLYCYKSL